MRWHSHPDVDGFLAATASLLDRAVVNQLPVGVARSVQMGTSRFDEVRCFTVTDAAGSLLGAVVQTPPWPALLSEMEPATAAFAARQLLAAHPEVRGVNGPEGAAQAFGEAAGATTGATGTRKVTSLGVWSLHAVSELPPAPAGTPRVATPDDAPLLQLWAQTFRDEAAPADPLPTPLAGSRYGGSGRAWLWTVQGKVVAFANFPRELVGYRSVGPVYTPPVHRGHGYATALVAHMSRLSLAQGMRGCTLFTDLANPTSNAIYARIGYQREATFARLDWGGE